MEEPPLLFRDLYALVVTWLSCHCLMVFLAHNPAAIHRAVYSSDRLCQRVGRPAGCFTVATILYDAERLRAVIAVVRHRHLLVANLASFFANGLPKSRLLE